MQDEDVLEGSSENQQSTPSDTVPSTAPSDDQPSLAQSSQEITSDLPQEGIEVNQQA